MIISGILDSEDGTINTRLARRDIDSLFSSNSPENSFYRAAATEASPKPLMLPSYAGGAFPGRTDRLSAPAQFEGNDLSVIEEVYR